MRAEDGGGRQRRRGKATPQPPAMMQLLPSDPPSASHRMSRHPLLRLLHSMACIALRLYCLVFLTGEDERRADAHESEERRCLGADDTAGGLEEEGEHVDCCGVWGEVV